MKVKEEPNHIEMHQTSKEIVVKAAKKNNSPIKHLFKLYLLFSREFFKVV